MAIQTSIIPRFSTADEVTLTMSGAIMSVKNGGVDTAQLKDLGVTTGKINDLGVTTGKIAANAVTIAKLDKGVLALIVGGI